jgi:hypothetical protein
MIRLIVMLVQHLTSIVFGIAAIAFVWFLLYPIPKIEDFPKTTVTITDCYVEVIRRGHSNLVLQTAQGKYRLETARIKDHRAEEAVDLISRSKLAEIWLYEPGSNFIVALNTDTFQLPPQRAIEWAEGQKMACFLLSLLFGVLGFANYKWGIHF